MPVNCGLRAPKSGRHLPRSCRRPRPPLWIRGGSNIVLTGATQAFAQSCARIPVAVQIRGSGGPWVNPDRASTSYLRWVEGEAKVLVDMGGRAFFRFGQSRAKLSDLLLVAISHLHPDHISDLPGVSVAEQSAAAGAVADHWSLGE